jgi:hypothetical protein
LAVIMALCTTKRLDHEAAAGGLGDWLAMSGHPRLTRRAVLLAAVAAPLAACRDKRAVRSPAVRTRPVDSDLRAALEVEQNLLAEYDAAMAASAATSGMPYSIFRAIHATHVDALADALGTAPSSIRATATTPAAGTPTAKTLRRHEATTGRALTAAAIAASDGNVAALLASISASHLAQSHMNFHEGGKG